VVALKDITSDLLDERDTAVKTASDYLQPHFDVLTPDMSLGEALQHFLAFQGERLPVIDCPARPVLLGVVYKTSLLDAYFRLNPASRLNCSLRANCGSLPKRPRDARLRPYSRFRSKNGRRHRLKQGSAGKHHSSGEALENRTGRLA